MAWDNSPRARLSNSFGSRSRSAMVTPSDYRRPVLVAPGTPWRKPDLVAINADVSHRKLMAAEPLQDSDSDSRVK
ncbi:hypothetical protein E0H73_36245 [Kribbella pittospori]|uniref:Uncharacterized protein n=1 Tax=Kribbella pittospori TaxID=722689 RepID=A0A4R0K8V2_9ACTN|nr:hypothetical protein [Kribbella pittospori]TCC55374.1 hypothetical protein E0H73_36245 [Kribbella pittospori]